jgi:hypothetical protein
MKIHNLENLLDFVFQTMEDASNEELRLSVYFLSIFLFTDQKHCWIYLDEIENGRDVIIGSLKREKVLRGIGLDHHEILEGIKQINDREILLIEPQGKSNYLLKVSLNINSPKYDFRKYI